MKVEDDKRAPLDDSICSRIIDIIERNIIETLKDQPSLGNVYLDDTLKNIVLPTNERASSSASQLMTRGSKVKMDHSDIIRLFVWWKGNVDVDLSIIGYDENWKQKTHISFTNTYDRYGSVHSGDIQNAPKGAAEFVDFDVNKYKNFGIRYVAMSVISYRGDGFNTFPCFAGFMKRDSLKSGKRFEPESVEVKFDIDSESRNVMPVIFDLETNEFVWCDLTNVSNRMFYCIEDDSKKLAVFTDVILNMTETKPTVYQLLEYHTKARAETYDIGMKIIDKEYDVVFDTSINIKDIMATYLKM
jgi:hypothetical protein